MRAALAVLLGGVVAALVAGGARSQPAMWTVHGGRGEVVLFGSVHLLPPGLSWRSPALDRVLARAGDIWFELPISQATDDAARRLIAREAPLPKGDTLWAHLAPAQAERVRRAAAEVGLDPDAFTALRPWMAEITLSLAEDARYGARATEGVEARLQADAPPTARRHALETVRLQVAILAGAPLPDQVASLDESAREVIEGGDLYDRTLRAWLVGDLAQVAHEDLDPLAAAAPVVYRRLIVDRNRRWAEILSRVARGTRGLTLVVVGAGHLIGPAGVPALLRAQGLAVDGP